MSNKISLNLYDPVIYKKFVENLILYWYNDFITFSDGIQEVIVKKTNISNIINSYNTSQTIYTRYIKSTINIICDNGYIIECLIVSSPQEPPGEGKIIKFNYVFGYELGPYNYTNGANTTINSYKDNNNLYKIENNTMYTYIGYVSFYDALNAAGIKFKPTIRKDFAYNILVDGKYAGNVNSDTQILSAAQRGLPSQCVLALECNENLISGGTNSAIIEWTDILKLIPFTVDGNAVVDNFTPTPRLDPSVKLWTGTISSNINFDEYKLPKNTDIFTMVLVFKLTFIGIGATVNITYGGNNGVNAIGLGISETNHYVNINGNNIAEYKYSDINNFSWSYVIFSVINPQPNYYNFTRQINNTSVNSGVLDPEIPPYNLGNNGIRIQTNRPVNIAGFYLFNNTLGFEQGSFLSYIGNKFGILP